MSIRANNIFIDNVKYNVNDISVVKYLDKNGGESILWTKSNKVTFRITNEVGQNLGDITCEYTDINNITKKVIIKDSFNIDYNFDYVLTDVRRNSSISCTIEIVGGRRGAGTWQDPYQYVYLNAGKLGISNVRPEESVTKTLTGELEITDDIVIGITAYWS